MKGNKFIDLVKGLVVKENYKLKSYVKGFVCLEKGKTIIKIRTK